MDTLTEPRVTSAAGCYRAEWHLPEADVDIQLDRLKSHSDGRLTGRLRVKAVTPDGEAPLYLGSFNAGSLQTRRQTSRALQDRFPLEGPAWEFIMESFCRQVLEGEQAGSPIRRLERRAQAEIEPSYLLRPLLAQGTSTVLYAPGGSGKSFAALLVALMVRNGLSLDGSTGEPGEVLIMDYESDWETASDRITKLARGLERVGWGEVPHLPLYTATVQPLAEQAAEVARTVLEHDVRLLVVDSIGLAAGGDLYAPESAVSLFRALRTITAANRTTVLLTGHTSKEDRRAQDQVRLLFGSTFFENLTRMAWELRSCPGRTTGHLNLSFFCRKSNVGPQEAFGLELSFGPEAILVRRAEPQDVVTEQGATRDVILAALAEGPASIGELAEVSGAPAATVRWHLMKLKAAGKVEPLRRGVYRAAEE